MSKADTQELTRLAHEGLCHYDPRSPFRAMDYGEVPPAPFPKPDNCSCDNCHRGKDKLANALLKLLGDSAGASKPIKNSIKVKRGIYITLVPHGYEVDFLRHKDVLDMYMRDKSFIMESEARSFGDTVDVVKATDAIIDALRNIEKTINEHPK